MSAAGEALEREVVEIDWDAETAEKQGFETFMLKEIHEQADAVAETIGERAARGIGIDLGDLGAIDDELLTDARRIVIVACGTSFHAGLIGRYAIEEWSRVPVEVEIASEYRYRNPVVGPGDLVIGISQSGETADTLAAMRTARERGATVLALTNIMGSQMTRDADGVLYTRAGPRDRRRGDEDIHHPGDGAVPAGAAARGAARDARAARAEGGDLRAEAPAAPDRGAVRARPRRGRADRRAMSRAEFFLYIGRHAGCRSRSRGRSSSRRSPTSPPTRTRPAR